VDGGKSLVYWAAAESGFSALDGMERAGAELVAPGIYRIDTGHMQFSKKPKRAQLPLENTQLKPVWRIFL